MKVAGKYLKNHIFEQDAEKTKSYEPLKTKNGKLK